MLGISISTDDRRLNFVRAASFTHFFHGFSVYSLIVICALTFFDGSFFRVDLILEREGHKINILSFNYLLFDGDFVKVNKFLGGTKPLDFPEIKLNSINQKLLFILEIMLKGPIL